MATDPYVLKQNLTTPGAGGGDGKVASVLFKLAAQLTPEVGFFPLPLSHLTFITPPGPIPRPKQQRP